MLHPALVKLFSEVCFRLWLHNDHVTLINKSASLWKRLHQINFFYINKFTLHKLQIRITCLWLKYTGLSQAQVCYFFKIKLQQLAMKYNQLNPQRCPNVSIRSTWYQRKHKDILGILEQHHVSVEIRRYSTEQFAKTFRRF